MKQIDLYKFAMKDGDMRVALTGIYNDQEAQVAVACDSHIMVVSKSHYNERRPGEIVARDGASILNCKYPKWQMVIPAVGTGEASGYGYFKADMNDLLAAYQNATFFRQNAPKKDRYGKTISRKGDIIVLGRFYDKTGEEVQVAVKYEYLRLLLSLPQEGATLWVRDARRSLYWVNESEGMQAIQMPVQFDKASADVAIQTGIHCYREAMATDEEDKGYYLGQSLISSTVSDQTRELFSKQEKVKVPMVKCLGENWMRPSVKLRPEEEVTPIEGTATFYKRETVDQWGNPDRPDLYKKDSGFMVYCGKAPSNWNGEALAILEKNDPLTYAQMVVANKWNEHPSERVKYFFKRIGQPVPAYC